MKNRLLFRFVFFCCAVFLFGRTAEASEGEILDRLRTAETVTYREAAYAFLVASGTLAGDRSIATVGSEMLSSEFGYSDVSPNEIVRIKDIAHMAMQSFSVPGGIMYRVFPVGRYAIRDLRYRELIAAEISATEPASGPQTLRLIASMLSLREENR